MGFEFIDLGPHRLPPIKTLHAAEPAEEFTKTTTIPRRNSEEEKCMTPKQAPRSVALPPPPPRKPRPAKRKFGPPDGYFPAPIDLAAVFVPVPSAVKRIRADGTDQTV
ncbi:hypothetical protein ZIOFF_070750 [Zingiber officinale]|uniref:Uncharacterized protein n=1 Tax=Zingiber officinale TaxID=94328 RepID=A0A8J5CAT7_ZINOF|nr:hypothetical protein ZIOFF_070750 [Zingiber officinale]